MSSLTGAKVAKFLGLRGARFLATKVDVPELIRQGRELGKASSRAALASVRQEVEELQVKVGGLAPHELLAGAELKDVCGLVRVLSSALMPPQEAFFDAIGEQVAKVAKVPDSLDAFAHFALAAAEAGHWGISQKVVKDLCFGGAASPNSLRGGGASALALSAAANGALDAPLLEALVRSCSAGEMDLTPAHLGDLRLATVLAKGVLDKSDSKVLGFLRTMCNDVLLDDPRGAPPAWLQYSDYLTDAEHDLSQALESCELPHCRGTVINGAFFPVSSNALKAVICLEMADAGGAYFNGPSARCTWQMWKYRVASAAGWRVYAIGKDDWETLKDTEQKVNFVRGLLQGSPLDLKAL